MPGNLKVQRGQMADGTINEYEVAGPVELRFKNRRTAVNAMVLSGNNEVLLGAIPMEDMDVLIHPLRQELIVNSDPPLFCSNGHGPPHRSEGEVVVLQQASTWRSSPKSFC